MSFSYNNKDLMKRPMKVAFSGKLEQIRMADTRFGYPRALFTHCLIDGRCERHHMWLPLSKKNLEKVQRGWWVECTATIYLYMNPETCKCDKIALKKLRNVKVSRNRR